jgi:hypothetical protein
MIATSTIVFSTPISTLNGCGIVVVLMGSSLYSYISLDEKQASSKPKTPTNSNDETEVDDKKNSSLELPDSDLPDVEGGPSEEERQGLISNQSAMRKR